MDSFGSANVVDTHGVTLALDVLLVLSLLAVWVGFARGAPTTERCVRSVALALLGAVAFSKIGSPQFLLWLLFPLALQAGRRGAAAGATFAFAAIATAGYFPFRYKHYLRLDDAWAAAVVLGKGLGLVAALALLAGPWLDDERLSRPWRTARRGGPRPGPAR